MIRKTVLAAGEVIKQLAVLAVLVTILFLGQILAA